jgi:hypothetical protein
MLKFHQVTQCDVLMRRLWWWLTFGVSHSTWRKPSAHSVLPPEWGRSQQVGINQFEQVGLIIQRRHHNRWDRSHRLRTLTRGEGQLVVQLLYSGQWHTWFLHPVAHAWPSYGHLFLFANPGLPVVVTSKIRTQSPKSPCTALIYSAHRTSFMSAPFAVFIHPVSPLTLQVIWYTGLHFIAHTGPLLCEPHLQYLYI